MAGGYSRHFTLLDIFNNKKLRSKLPLVNYKEREDENGKVHRTTAMKTISRFVYDKSVSAARPFYEPLTPHKAGDTILIEGKLVGDHNGALETIYAALVASKFLMELTVNNADMVRAALKEAERTKPAPKLYLKQTSMEQIEGLNKKGLQAFMQDVMQNLFYSDDYQKTQQKYGVEKIGVGNHFTYEQNKARWERKVGAI